jgi:two-component system NtrC family sensor kinase
LQVINSSPGDLTPVFDAMLDKATTLCDAHSGFLWTYDGERFRAAATRGLPPRFEEFVREPRVPGPETGIARLAGGEPLVHFTNLATIDSYEAGDALHRASVDLGGFRTILIAPLRKDDALLGGFTIERQEVRPFSDKQIALLQNFAAQAVIAMENARLITETREALEQQTATAEVLRVINSSPGDVTPVFDAILEKATTLCGAAFGALSIYRGDDHHQIVAMRNVPAVIAGLFGDSAVYLGPETGMGRLVRGEAFVHIADASDDDGYRMGNPLRRALVDLAGTRTYLAVPLLKDGTQLGAFTIYRQEIDPFTDKQIALLQNFAAQAVIAIENARLFSELRERTTDLTQSLEYQTATSDVLKVISQSTFDLQPVLRTVVNTAARLCLADHAGLYRNEGGEYRWAAGYGQSPEYERIERNVRILPGTGSLVGRTAFERRTVEILDAATDPLYEPKEDARVGGVHSMLGVPLLREGLPIGVIGLARTRVEPFTDKQIELVRTFADQAVIAIENARLITETREALDQQTATSDVLKVISQSTFDLEPVLQTVLDTTMRLCSNSQGSIFRLGEDGLYRQAVGSGMQPEYYEIEARQEIRSGSATLVGRTAAAARPIQITDAWADPDYAPKEDARVGQLRSMLGVPLLREGMPIGVICTARTIVKPFTEKEIELVATFADQAVIAIENARLLGELRQREAELRVTFDNMVDGVAMFDQALHLAAWNRNFQQLLQLPDGVFAERLGFDDYIRYLSERGEFGETDPEAEIARLRSRLGDHYSFERTRPDGTIIEVRHNPMPDGGVVLIYSDITERKRSEEEIRAARDAAEAAYADLKAAQANLIQAEKMASLGQLTAGIAHEIKNPLNFVNNFASLSVELLDELKETTAPALAALDQDKRSGVDDRMELLTGNLEKIAEHGKRADNIVKSMLEHSRGVSGERRKVDLNGVIEEALNLAYHGARAQDQSFNISLERDYAQSLKPIELAPREMTRVFLNLFGNGFYAANKRARENGDGSYRPSLTVVTREDGNAVVVRVRDNGTGIPPEIKDKLFQPFFTTKPTGEGTGLGLSISYDIVTQQHGGTIMVESEPGAFTEFTVRLPRQ